jgi:hypothetical protein
MEYEEDSQEGGFKKEIPPVYFAGDYYFSSQQVQDAFGPTNEKLMYKYFTNPWTAETLHIEKGDRKRVFQIINSKLQGLTRKDRLGHPVKDTNRGLLINARPLRISDELSLLKNRIINPGPSIPTANDEQLAKIEELSRKQVATLLFQNAWWLLHPTDVPKEVRASWLAILEENKQASELDVLLKLMDKNKITTPENKLKAFMDLEIAKPVITKQSMKSAAATSAASFGSGSKAIQAQLQARLQQTFEIFGTLGLVSPSRLDTLKATKLGQLEASIAALPKEIARKLLKSMNPIYTYYQRQYGDAYDVIEKFMVNGFTGKIGTLGPRAPVSFPIDAILTLLERSQQIRESIENKTIGDEGLVHVMNLSSDVITQFKSVQEKIIDYVNTQYKNSAIKTADSPSSRLYDLLAGTDTHILQFMSPTITVPTLPEFRKGTPSKTDAERKDLLATATSFFEKSSKNIYVVVQPRTETKDRKKIDELKPYLYELPKTTALKAFNKLADIPNTTFNSLNINVRQQPDFVRSITDRSAALMAILYFRLMLEKVAPPTARRNTSKKPKPIVGNATGQAATGTGQATATTATGTQSQPVPSQSKV